MMACSPSRPVDWEAWILFMLPVVTEAARWAMDMIDAIRNLLDATAERIRDAG